MSSVVMKGDGMCLWLRSRYLGDFCGLGRGLGFAGGYRFERGKEGGISIDGSS